MDFVDEVVIQIIRDNKSLIKDQKFDKVYDTASKKLSEETYRLTQILIDAGYNPLPEFEDTIPSFYMMDYKKAPSSISIPEGIKTIGQFAFAYTNVGNVEFPTSLELLGLRCFQATNIKTVALHKGMELIGDYVFADCFELENVYLPTSISELGEEIFRNCHKLSTVHYDGTRDEFDAVFNAKRNCNWCKHSSIRKVVCKGGILLAENDFKKV